MRTNIDIDNGLLEEAFSVSQVRTGKDLIRPQEIRYNHKRHN
ncbi:MAG: type II toxin-antitoxin system VapB family antitoxin [Deltaproteobacteria bacterium]|nr:type II toxin-antitoxin system VapB family antitoxin [Deltaproteobacteria bacterium]